MEAEIRMSEVPEAVDSGIVTKWIERYYEEKLDKREKRNEAVSAKEKMMANPFIRQLMYLN